MASWYDAWADRYAEWSTGLIADVPLDVELARHADGPLVELAVGTGRVAVPVARQRASVYARTVFALAGLWFDRR